MTSKNLISIIIPVYNGERFVGKAIESCLHQSEKQGWEAIVVNDGSTDNSQQVVESYLDDPRIKLIVHEKNKGLPSARNTGIRNSAGNYVAFLDTDDCYMPHTIKNFHTACEKARRTIAMFYSDYLCINEKGETTGAKRVPPPMKRPDLHFQVLLPRLKDIQPSTSIIRKDALEKVGMFDERFLSCEDIELFTRIIERYDIAKLGFFSTRRRFHQEQMTKDTSTMIFWREEFNLEYLKRHDFCYFCTTHDRKKQAVVAEGYGDMMMKALPPWGPYPRTAEYLYELSLSMRYSPRVLTKLRSLKADEVPGDQSGEE